MRETGHSESGERLPVVKLGFRVVVAKNRLIVYRLIVYRRRDLLVLSISLWDCYSCLHPALTARSTSIRLSLLVTEKDVTDCRGLDQDAEPTVGV